MKGLKMGLGLASGRSGPSFGPELLTDGDFTNGTGWVPSGGWSVSSGRGVGTNASNSLVATPNPLISGKTYCATFDYTMTSGVGLRVSDGIAQFPGVPLGTSGSASSTFTATNAGFMLQADGGLFTGTVDNVSVREVL